MEMVRTKHLRKKSSFVRRKTQSSVNNNKTSSESSSENAVYNLINNEYESSEDLKKELNTFYESELKRLKESYEKTCSYIKQLVSEKLQSMPEEYCNSNIFAIEGNFQNQNVNLNTPTPPPVRKHMSRKSLEAFDFKKPKSPRVPSRTSTRKRAASVSDSSSSTAEKYKTPLMNSRRKAMGHTITPKIYSNTPMSVMRRPLMGEMAVSLTGSPLLVGSVTCEEVPTVNVPLMDGRVFSIMPEEGAPPPDLPDFDEQTKDYLRTLQAHLAFLAPKNP